MISRVIYNHLFFILACIFSLSAFAEDRGDAQAKHWQQLANGLDFAIFSSDNKVSVGDGQIYILRVDPQLWQFNVYSKKELKLEYNMSAKQWAEKYDLAVVINAGMFQADYSTHVGYMKVGTSINSRGVNHYQSVLAFSAYDSSLAYYQIFDLDNPDVELKKIKSDYRYVIQNLRLIKGPGDNRWKQQSKRWSEAAIGVDQQGRALLIYTRSPFTMYELNEMLLNLPIGLVSAQHLEGGPEAQLYIKQDEFFFDAYGSYETNFNPNDDNVAAWPIPNIIGISKRNKSE